MLAGEEKRKSPIMIGGLVELKPQARRLQESAAAGWSASDSENIE
ncbi:MULTISPECIES: hypothetical protein [Enterobacteriaceae]|nr:MULTISPECIES: hypothetical protein [Enterobacteriaceae]AIF60020.1 hypothetical protein L960_0197 [Escherichia coli B7A]EDV62768.1 hypothetical protein EcB7A_5043 [Escherichia coli B7A]EFW73784.1 PE-PGRS family protein [Escherichia coli EC4100B]MCT7393016.1 hypothetical protein [Escherichia coli]MCT9860059.1 hypothetical protein [Escherichia coli]